MSKTKKKSVIVLILMAFIAILSGSLIWLSTLNGPGIGGDSTIYIVSARNLLSGEGLGWVEPDGSFSLLEDFPPGYPLLLALLGLPGGNIIHVARWVNVLLFGGFVWLSGVQIYKATKSYLWALFSSMLLGFSPVLIPIYSWAMSEPLFLLASFGSLFSLWRFLITRRSIWFILSTAGVGYAFLTRYSGIVLILFAGLVLLLFNQVKMKKRILHGALFSALALLPMGLWEIIFVVSSGKLSSRQIWTNVNVMERVHDFFTSFTHSLLFWVFPDSWVYEGRVPQGISLALILVSIAILFVWVGWMLYQFKRRAGKTSIKEPETLFQILLLFFVLYFIFLIATHMLVFPVIAINNRMLSPLYISLILVIILLGYFTTQMWNNQKILRIILFSVFGLATIWYARSSIYLANQLSQNGLGYTSKAWSNSDLIKEIGNLPANAVIVTNEPKAVLLLTGRNPYSLEEIFFKEPLKTYHRYGEGNLQEDQGQKAFRYGAALALFNSINDQMHRLYLGKTQERIAILLDGLYNYFEGNDGEIFYYESP